MEPDLNFEALNKKSAFEIKMNRAISVKTEKEAKEPSPDDTKEMSSSDKLIFGSPSPKSALKKLKLLYSSPRTEIHLLYDEISSKLLVMKVIYLAHMS